MNYIDLFSGAGGFSLGFCWQGFKNVFSIDLSPQFCQTYRHNFKNHLLIEGDLCTLSDAQIRTLAAKAEKVDVVIGGPPCQGFSLAGKTGRQFLDDPRNKLFKEFARVVRLVKPSFFVMENVARLAAHNKGATCAEIIASFRRLGYRIAHQVLNAADYGVPQMRRRLIFIGTLTPLPIPFPEPKTPVYLTVKQALEHYPALKSGESSAIPNHVAMNHSVQMLEKMSYISDGGNRNQIPLHLRPKSGDIRKYIRYKSDAPAVCVTGDMRKIFHYTQNRALTVRELAKLQSFPDDFVFKGSKISQQQQVGNAVPPKMAAALAAALRPVLQLIANNKPNHIENGK